LTLDSSAERKLEGLVVFILCVLKVKIGFGGCRAMGLSMVDRQGEGCSAADFQVGAGGLVLKVCVRRRLANQAGNEKE